MQIAPAPRCASASPKDRNQSLDPHPHLLVVCSSSWRRSTRPGDGPTIAFEPAQTSPSSRGLNVGRGTDVGPRFTIAKECICNARAANEHPAVEWNSAAFFCTASACVKARQKCESKSRHGPADFFDTPGLAVCDSSRSGSETSGVLRSRLSLDQPRQEERWIHIAEVAWPAYEKSRQEVLLEVQ
jgi:hypothetical protein